jgi:protein-S-isoprenylcysteine O-methyltransferase Ste14
MHAEPSAKEPADKSEAIRAVRKKLWKLVFLPAFVAAFFLLAGRWDWLMGWLFVGVVFTIGPVISLIVLVPRQPEMCLERMSGRKPVKSWDKVLYPIIAVSALAVWLLPPLDFRLGWSPRLPLWLQLAALGVSLIGYIGAIWAMAHNKFFSKIAYVQKDRGHTVATGGPYGIVRHPGYTTMSLMMLSVPLALGSLWSLIPAGICVLGVVIRTVFEDRMLHEELDGYREYAQRVRCRLVPGLW